MKRTSLQNRDTEEAISKIDAAIRSRYPEVDDIQAEQLRGKVLNYVGSGLAEGYDLALIKRSGARTILKVLKLIKEDDEL